MQPRKRRNNHPIQHNTSFNHMRIIFCLASRNATPRSTAQDQLQKGNEALASYLISQLISQSLCTLQLIRDPLPITMQFTWSCHNCAILMARENRIWGSAHMFYLVSSSAAAAAQPTHSTPLELIAERRWLIDKHFAGRWLADPPVPVKLSVGREAPFVVV